MLIYVNLWLVIILIYNKLVTLQVYYLMFLLLLYQKQIITNIKMIISLFHFTHPHKLSAGITVITHCFVTNAVTHQSWKIQWNHCLYFLQKTQAYVLRTIWLKTNLQTRGSGSESGQHKHLGSVMSMKRGRIYREECSNETVRRIEAQSVSHDAAKARFSTKVLRVTHTSWQVSGVPSERTQI